MLKMINFYLDTEKDKELIEWLNTKTNRSAYIRGVLYEVLPKKVSPHSPSSPSPKKQDNFINSFANFTKVDK